MEILIFYKNVVNQGIFKGLKESYCIKSQKTYNYAIYWFEILMKNS